MLAKPVILIVDDEPSNIELLSGLLKDDYAIKVATSGERCVEIATASPPDLILLDIQMPGMDGYDVCRLMQSSQPTSDIPIIFVTGKGQVDDEEYGLKLGAVDYITKPFSAAIVVARVKTHITIKQQRDELQKLAMRDQLTGLYNRHFLVDAAAKKIARAMRHNTPLSLIMVDVDYFKRVNDEYGHGVGDSVLSDVAAIIENDCREEDIAARFGGEEFVVLLENCDLAACKQKAEHLRQRLEESCPQGITITGSFGVAELASNGEGLSKLLSRADTAVYRAKDNGRNRVEIAKND